MFIEMKPYGRGENVYVDVGRVVYIEPYQSNCYSGSILHMDDQRELLVGNYPSDVAEILNSAKGQD